jgi:hypothetical protein
MDERRLPRALTFSADLRIFSQRQLIHNLPAGVPKGMPCNSKITTLFGDFIPSGPVPGNGADALDWRRRRELGG